MVARGTPASWARFAAWPSAWARVAGFACCVASLGAAASTALAVANEPGTSGPCSARIRVAPERPVVGQAVHYSLRVTFGAEHDGLQWIDPPRFPGLRPEWLQDFAGDGVRELHRVLFAMAPGPYELPPVQLRCLRRDRAARELARVQEIPAFALEVAELPDSSLAPGFEGLVASHVALEVVAPRQLGLGGSLRLTLTLESEGNVWVEPAPSPVVRLAGLTGLADLAGLAGGERVDVFDEVSPAIERLPGRRAEDGLRFRRRFEWSVVPRATGRLTIEPIEVVFFDPATRAFRSARSRLVEIEITPKAGSR